MAHRLGIGVAFVCVALGGWSLAACVGDDPLISSPTGGDDDAATGEDASSGDAAPADASGPASAVDVAAGSGFACAALSDGQVACWGANDFGQLAQPAVGDGTCGTKPCRPPTRVAGLSNVVRVAAGGEAACAVTSAGEVFCWGINENGQLGHANGPDETCPGGKKCVRTPTKVEGLSDVVEVAMTRSAACAVTKSGRLFCWGANASGQLGRGTPTATFELPGAVPTFDTGGVVHVAGDTYTTSHFCASKQDGTVWCWGRAVVGACGVANPPYCATGQEPCVATPTQVFKTGAVPLTEVQSVSANDGATCVTLVGGAVWCWGFKGHAIADEADGGTDVTPKVRSSISGLSDVVGSFTHVCGLRAGGVVTCWGTNDSGELGAEVASTPPTCAGATPCSSLARDVATIRASRLAAGTRVSFARTPEGKIFGWGTNAAGELGHAPTPAEQAACAQACSPTPVEIPLP